MLKYVLFNNNIGHIKLHRVSLIYRLINRIIDNLEDFRIDWQRRSTAAKVSWTLVAYTTGCVD